jgi:small GTP-binding protein
MLENVPGWWKTLSNLGMVASVILDPTKLPRHIAMRGASTPLMNQVKSNLLGTFCRFYLQRVGYYLIELNSGRLRGGSARYRQTMDRIDSTSSSPSGTSAAPTAPPEPVTVTIAIVGQVKAGKSSLANCLLGEQQAAVDVLPLTKDVTRYGLAETALSDGTTNQLVLLDTPGYSDAGMTAAQKEATREAVRQADLVLLVMAATSPAKQADVEMLRELTQWFESQHRLKPPPVIGVVSKVDALSPVMEWAPPYDWEQPTRPKEHSIHEAVRYASEALGSGLSATIPVVTHRESRRVYGVEEWLWPTVALHLDDARAVSLVRTLHQEYDTQKAGQVVSQLMQVGRRIKDAVQAHFTSD